MESYVKLYSWFADDLFATSQKLLRLRHLGFSGAVLTTSFNNVVLVELFGPSEQVDILMRVFSW